MRPINGRTLFLNIMRKKANMENHLVDEIIECLPKQRSVFRYFKGRYAPMLLRHVVGAGRPVAELKKTAFAALLDKPEVKAALAMAGHGVITPQLLNSIWQGQDYAFILTLGRWGSNRSNYDQTSRSGYNLVLQLNFSSQHDRVYRSMVQPGDTQMLNYCAHPVLRKNMRKYLRETLAWARLDVDFASDTVLIEEIQSDWVRWAKYLLHHARRRKALNWETVSWKSSEGKVDDVIRYCESVLTPYEQLWDEAMLAMTIDFIKNELGMSTIFYHSDRTGHLIKRIDSGKPPKSLYNTLPRRFCFSKTTQAPEFLFADRHFRRLYKKIAQPTWYSMTL